MSLFSDPTDINSYGRSLAQLLLIGGVQLESMVKGPERVCFDAWAESVATDARKRGVPVDDGQLSWLWDALTSEQSVKAELGARIVSRDEEWRSQEPVSVLNAGEMFGVFLKPFRAYGSPVLGIPSEVPAQAMVTLKGELMMVPGKARSRRFECRDVACEVSISADGVGTAEREAVLLKVDAKLVAVGGKTVTVRAKSLNHAYTLASRRLEPERRNAGGRAYDHLAWREGSQWVSLERIRSEVESGEWKGAMT